MNRILRRVDKNRFLKLENYLYDKTAFNIFTTTYSIIRINLKERFLKIENQFHILRLLKNHKNE